MEFVFKNYHKENNIQELINDPQIVFAYGNTYLTKHTLPDSNEKFYSILKNNIEIGKLRISFNPEYKRAWLNFFIIKEKYRSQKFGEKALKQFLNYLFKHLRYQKLIIIVKNNNLLAHSFLYKLGASIEGYLEDEFYEDLVDCIIFSFKNNHDKDINNS